MLDDHDRRITPRRVTSEIPSEFPFPSGAFNGEIYNVLELTVAYQGPQDVDMGGRIIEEVLEDDAPAPAEPTPQRGKRPADEATPYVLAPKRLHPSGPQHDLPISLSDLNVDSPALCYDGVDVLEVGRVRGDDRGEDGGQDDQHQEGQSDQRPPLVEEAGPEARSALRQLVGPVGGGGHRVPANEGIIGPGRAPGRHASLTLGFR